MVSTGNQDLASKKKSRRSSRDDTAFSHYGPVACTSGAAALIQAYLSFESMHQSEETERGNAVKRGESVLYMSESRFDPIKRRFGGKSKAVSFANWGDGGVDGTGRRTRLNFGPKARIVATKEGMHATLHCRCVFILLYEIGSEIDTSDGSQEDVGNPSTHERTDQAHLVTLSPNDLFSALSVDPFPLSVYPTTVEAVENHSDHYAGLLQDPVGNFLPRAFEVMDGPVVLHRPPAVPGEPWRGLEVLRPVPRRDEDGFVISWHGRRLLAPTSNQASEGADTVGDTHNDKPGFPSDATDTYNNIRLGHGSESIEHQASGAEAATLMIREHMGYTRGNFLLCSPCQSCENTPTMLSRCGHQKRPGSSGAVSNAAAAIVALPTTASPETTVVSLRPTLASLHFDRGDRASISPWWNSPSGGQSHFTCLCRAPPSDSGVVGLADAAFGVGVGDGLVVNPLPPTIYVGATDDDNDDGGEVEHDVGSVRRRGALWELQGGRALSCARSLPAPPVSITSAAVDDGNGILAVLLGDVSGTALLIARDGSEFPVVEEYQGVSAIFSGDFLGNGREQVALLHVVTSRATSAAASSTGSSKGARRGTLGAPGELGPWEWEQLPLKTLVKRALVTDCSSVWGNGQRDDLAAMPESGPIHVIGPRPQGMCGRGKEMPVGKTTAGGADMSAGRKRQRVEASKDLAVEGGRIKSSIKSVATGTKQVDSMNNHRLGRLSTVVSVLRRRVQTEEARLLRLRQSRRGKAALLEAVKSVLTSQVSREGLCSSDSSRRPALFSSAVDTFSEGLVACFSETSVSPTPRSGEHKEHHDTVHDLRCVLACVRFHAPAQMLCVDCAITNPYPETSGGSNQEAPKVAINTCLSIVSPSRRLGIRSAVCSRLAPGESATVRACVEVSPDVLADRIASPGGLASLFVSCSWSWDSNVDEGQPTQRIPTTVRHSAMFGRIVLSPQDMLGMAMVGPTGDASASGLDERGYSSVKRDRLDGSDNLKGVNLHLGLFDVGIRLDLLARTDHTSQASLPQAARALSCFASLPEPWAGGASTLMSACSKRTTGYTLRAGDSKGAAAVVLRVAAGVLPDGVRMFADHASDEARALVIAAVQSLIEEMVALGTIAREHRGARQASPGVGRGEEALLGALEQYVTAQMKTDVLAAQLAARLVASRGNVGRA